MSKYIPLGVAALLSFLLVACSLSTASAANVPGLGFQVSAGDYKTDAAEGMDFTAGNYGTVTGEATNSDPSLAGRAIFRQANGFELGLGVRTGNNEYKAALGAAAQADVAANNAEIKARQDAIDLLDTESPTYDEDVAALEAEKVPFVTSNNAIAASHITTSDQVGASLTAMKFQKVGQGEFGFGSEAFIGKEGTVAAAKVAYRDQLHGGINLGVEAYAGDGWAGAGLTADF